jgi:hypothetical protein
MAETQDVVVSDNQVRLKDFMKENFMKAAVEKQDQSRLRR